MLRNIFVILIILIFSINIYSEDNLVKINFEDELYLIDNIQNFRINEEPVLALALGGGGARAFVNIGILKALEEENIPIDFIVGSSMGSIVGVLYGSGLPISQIEQIVIDSPISKLFEISLISTQSLLNTYKFNKFTEEVLPVSNIDDFPIPTAILSYDLNSGNKYLITEGNISKILLGGYAIPFYFPLPTKNGRYLIDPGLLEIIPAKSARVLGADIVISTACFDELPYTKYNSPIKSTYRFLSLVQKRNARPIIDNYSDIEIITDVGNYSFMDFKLADKFIEIGYNEARKKIDEIKSLLITKGKELRPINEKKPTNIQELFKDIKYERFVLEDLQLKPLYYYGKNQSFFSQSLFKNDYFSSQPGLKINKNNVEFEFLYKSKENYEGKLRWIKFTDNTDLLSKIKYNIKTNNYDYKMGINYYHYNYLFGLGMAYINDNNYIYIDNNIDKKIKNFHILSENNILLKDNEIYYLASFKGNLRINKPISIVSKITLNNNDIINFPLIYRGFIQDESLEFQTGVEIVYDYIFDYPLELMQIFQLSNIKSFCFLDYQKSDSQGFTTGIGTEVNINLLGLKPFNLGINYGYDFEQKSNKIGFQIEFEL
jgi:NTE family protein